ncbi:hypothetical protein ACWCXM_13045 [Streptomyces sp. 900105755]
MRINHIVGRHLRKKKRTTIEDRTAPPAPDLVMRDFTADTLNTRWCGDITYAAVGSRRRSTHWRGCARPLGSVWLPV